MKLTRATVPMCSECKSEVMPVGMYSPEMIIESTCAKCGHFGRVHWGYYAPYVHATDCTECEFFGRGDPLVDGVAAVAQEMGAALLLYVGRGGVLLANIADWKRRLEGSK